MKTVSLKKFTEFRNPPPPGILEAMAQLLKPLKKIRKPRKKK
jgi:hypothetical protein